MTARDDRVSQRVEHIHSLSALQQGMVFHGLMGAAYVQQVACRIKGALDPAAFRRAWGLVMDRHTLLRASIHWTDQAQSRVVVHRHASLPWTEHDLSHLPPPEQAAQLDELSRDDWARGFDLMKAPLFRLTLVRLADDVHQLVWSNHHAILDGWSRSLVFGEVMKAYRAEISGLTVELPTPKPYRDYIAWLRKQDPARAESFWRGYLSGFAAPTTLPVTAGVRSTAARTSLELSRAATDALRDFARRHGLTLATLVEGAWGLLLGRHCGEQDVVFGTTVAGRSPKLPGVESMVGLLINTLPVRVRWDPELPVLEWLRELQTSLVEMREYEHTPLTDIQGWSEVPRDAALFDSLVVFENYPLDPAGHEDIAVDEIQAREETHYGLALIAAADAQLHLRLLSQVDRYDVNTVAGLLDRLKVVLTSLAADPERRLGDVPWSSAEEQRLITQVWSRPPAAEITPRCLHELFEAQAVRTPDAVAVSSDDQQLTYAALDARATDLARYLRTLGVGREAGVAVCLPRSPMLVLSLLAIMKAGGTYVPLDPSYPADRLSFMLADSQAAVLLTDSGMAPLPATTVFHVDQPCPLVDDEPLPRTTPDDLAYIIYTSGSTGRPKGTLLSHRGIAPLAHAQATTFNAGPG
ncbi:MAG: putative linear pentadecapeptide gramicidin synthetase LgrB, partial [Actinomycetia bacterium]|nr:putative linear pentadecapeptide gramicidin synthetase LgrB [Actinomycetes bacterium]